MQLYQAEVVSDGGNDKEAARLVDAALNQLTEQERGEVGFTVGRAFEEGPASIFVVIYDDEFNLDLVKLFPGLIFQPVGFRLVKTIEIKADENGEVQMEEVDGEEFIDEVE